jgi:uncharacterized protein
VDPRAPLVLSTHDLGRRPGSMRRLKRTVPAPPDLGTPLVGVEQGSDLDLDLRLEAVMEGVLVTGTIRGAVVGQCGRCLEPVSEAFTAPVQDLFVHPGHEVGEDEDGEDLPVLEGELMDLEPLVRDAIVTALPFQPLCRPDCPGLCSICGARLADVRAPHVHEEVDPRWAALEGLVTDEGGEGPE